MEEKELALSKPNRTSTDLCVFSSIEGFEIGQRMAVALNKSNIVPKDFQGDNNLGNCLIALDLAARMGLNPLTLMRGMYVYNGTPSFYGQFVIALVNSSGLYKSRLKFEQVGEIGKPTFGYRAYAIDYDGDKVYGPVVDMQMAINEGWFNRNPKWKNMTELMLRYRSGAFFQKANCPELTFGIPTKEEIEDENVAIDIPSHEVIEIDVDAAPVVEAPKEPVPPIKGDIDF